MGKLANVLKIFTSTCTGSAADLLTPSANPLRLEAMGALALESERNHTVNSSIRYLLRYVHKIDEWRYICS